MDFDYLRNRLSEKFAYLALQIGLTRGKFTLRITNNASQVCKIEVILYLRAICLRVRDNVWVTEDDCVTVNMSDAPKHIDDEFRELLLAYCGAHGYAEGHFDDGIKRLGNQSGC